MNLIQLSNGDWINPADVKSIWADQFPDESGKYESGVDFKRGGVVQQFDTQSESFRFRDDCARKVNDALQAFNGPMINPSHLK